MFKFQVIWAQNGLRDDRLSFMRLLGLRPSDRVPDAKTTWMLRDRLTRTGYK